MKEWRMILNWAGKKRKSVTVYFFNNLSKTLEISIMGPLGCIKGREKILLTVRGLNEEFTSRAARFIANRFLCTRSVLSWECSIPSKMEDFPSIPASWLEKIPKAPKDARLITLRPPLWTFSSLSLSLSLCNTSSTSCFSG